MQQVTLALAIVAASLVSACEEPAEFIDAARPAPRPDACAVATETCNEQDDDCDGLTDEDRICECHDGVRNGDEAGIDCGDVCGSCDCSACAGDQDCARGRCADGICLALPEAVAADAGATIEAYVRADGAILVAHYGAGTTHGTFNPALAQQTTIGGGATPPAGWSPDPCTGSGHVAYPTWNPAGRAVILECGTSVADVQLSVASSTLFTSFADGTYGVYGATGTPGWGLIAGVGSGQGRSNHASCGGVQNSTTGGVSYCSGVGAPLQYSNHLVSYYATNLPESPFLGCAGTGCNGPDCDLEIWVWLR